MLNKMLLKVALMCLTLVLAVTCVCTGMAEDPIENQRGKISGEIGTIIEFGKYEQDNDTTNGTESIEWIIVDKNETKALLVSKYALDAHPYHNQWDNSVKWEQSSLRSWLNTFFMENAFTSSERKAIQLTQVSNARNQARLVGAADGGKDSEDYIFLLSGAECGNYLTSDLLILKATDYAISMNPDHIASDGLCYWWTRSPGMSDGSFKSIQDNGWSYQSSMTDQLCVRPSMWVDLDLVGVEDDDTDYRNDEVGGTGNYMDAVNGFDAFLTPTPKQMTREGLKEKYPAGMCNDGITCVYFADDGKVMTLINAKEAVNSYTYYDQLTEKTFDDIIYLYNKYGKGYGIADNDGLVWWIQGDKDESKFLCYSNLIDDDTVAGDGTVFAYSDPKKFILSVRESVYPETLTDEEKDYLAGSPENEEFEELKKGSKGKKVIDLQNRLNELGYSVGKVDGDYGNATAKAITEFQRINNLSETGTADKETLIKLFSDEAFPAETSTQQEINDVMS